MFLLVIGVLKGVFFFMVDFIKYIDIYLEMDFMDVLSYGNFMVFFGEVKIIKDLDIFVEGWDILIIEDIIDSGLILSYLVEFFWYCKVKLIKIVIFLDKLSGRKVDIKVDFVGFEVFDVFVVGYGFDYVECYCNLFYIGVLKLVVYESWLVVCFWDGYCLYWNDFLWYYWI